MEWYDSQFNPITTIQVFFLQILHGNQVFALIYNMVRQVMMEAARRQDVDIRRVSFIDALRWLQTVDLGDELPILAVNPHIRKRRSKQYPPMAKPRKQLKKELMG